MKPFLAALSCLLLMSPAFAQNAAPHPCQNRDQGWKAAFNSIEARFQALPADLKGGAIPAAKLNKSCAKYKGAGDFESCGAIVDRSVLKEAGLEQQGKSWMIDGNTITSVEGGPIFDRVCQMRDDRESIRKDGATQAQKDDANRAAAIAQQKASQARTLAMAKKVLAEADNSGIGAPSYAMPAPTAAPAAAPKAAPMSMVTVTMGSPCASKSGADKDKCWCDLVQSPECSSHETGACMEAASMCPSMSQ
ncbi:MAG: hypothetical protein ACHQ2Z_08705 [Elusimicrobiota bacterium]